MTPSSISSSLADRVLLAALLGASLLGVPTAARPQSVAPGRASSNRFEAAPRHGGPSFAFATIFAGVDAGQSSVWEGGLSGPEGGQLRLSLWQVEPAEAAANPIWHVRTRWEARPGVDAHAFVAEMEGIVDWKTGTAHLSGVVTSGWQKGTWMEAEVRFVQGDAEGTLKAVRSRI
jgi:hypothetical protein